MTSNTHGATQATTTRPNLPKLPRDFGAEYVAEYRRTRGIGSIFHDDVDYYDEASFYVLRARGFFPTTRTVFLLLLVEPCEKLVQLAGPVKRKLCYVLYFPIGLVATCVALLGFVLWFECCCQPWMVDHELVGGVWQGPSLCSTKKKYADGGHRRTTGSGTRSPKTTAHYNLSLYIHLLFGEQTSRGES
jgi:hypothetical protein